MHFRESRLALVFLVLISIASSCSQRPNRLKDKLKLNETVLTPLFTKYGDNVAILSCLRCECFVNAFNKNFTKHNSIREDTGSLQIQDATACTLP